MPSDGFDDPPVTGGASRALSEVNSIDDEFHHLEIFGLLWMLKRIGMRQLSHSVLPDPCTSTRKAAAQQR